MLWSLNLRALLLYYSYYSIILDFSLSGVRFILCIFVDSYSFIFNMLKMLPTGVRLFTTDISYTLLF